MATGGEPAPTSSPYAPTPAPAARKGKPRLEVEGYPVEGISIGGQETCVIFPSLSLAFDIGRCPQRAISQDFLFISHAHLDHIGGLPMYVATRGLFRMRPPTIFVPACIADLVARLFEVHRAMDQSELAHKLVPLQVGEEYQLRMDLKVRAFRTYHAIPSQVRFTSPLQLCVFLFLLIDSSESIALFGGNVSQAMSVGLCGIRRQAKAQAGVSWSPGERDKEAQIIWC
jgi:ribonuclease Z